MKLYCLQRLQYVGSLEALDTTDHLGTSNNTPCTIIPLTKVSIQSDEQRKYDHGRHCVFRCPPHIAPFQNPNHGSYVPSRSIPFNTPCPNPIRTFATRSSTHHHTHRISGLKTPTRVAGLRDVRVRVCTVSSMTVFSMAVIGMPMLIPVLVGVLGVIGRASAGHKSVVVASIGGGGGGGGVSLVIMVARSALFVVVVTLIALHRLSIPR